MWDLARTPQTISEKGLTIVPVKVPKEVNQHGRGAQLVFYPDAGCETPVELVIYQAYEYDETRPFHIENSTFSGFVSVFSYCDCSINAFPVTEGRILEPVETSFEFPECTSDVADERNMWWQGGFGDDDTGGTGIGKPRCPWDKDLWDHIVNFFENIGEGLGNINLGDGEGNAGNPSYSWTPSSYTGFPYYVGSNGTAGGSGGGSSSVMTSIFQGVFFNGEGQTVIDLLNEIIAEQDLGICTEQLHNSLYSCMNENLSDFQTGPPPPPGETLSLNAYISGIMNMSSNSSCLSSLITSYSTSTNMEGDDGSLLCFIQQNNNFDIDDTDLLQIMKDECGDDGDCKLDLINCFNRLDALQTTHEITLNEKNINDLLNSDIDLCTATNSVLNRWLFLNTQLPDSEEGVFTDPLLNGDIWAIGAPIKQQLQNDWSGDPEALAKINSFFSCRVLSMAIEDVVLESLANFDDNNSPIPGSGMTAKPDGYNFQTYIGPGDPMALYHCITEVKTKFSSPFNFTWSSNPDQFSQYISFLNENQWEGLAPNTLYLILPSGISIDPTILNQCTQNNVNLIVSRIEMSSWDSDLVRVTTPKSMNKWQISWHPAQFEFMIKITGENELQGPWGFFNYDYVNLRDAIEARAESFEQSYLIGDEDINCPPE